MEFKAGAADPHRAAEPPRVMHIATVHPAMDARIFYREAQTLRRMGWEVTVCGIASEDVIVDGVRIIGLPAVPGRLRRILTSWWRAWRLVRRHRADLYQFHEFELLPAALLAKVISRRRVLYDAHEDVSLVMLKDWLPRWLRRLLAACLRRMTAFCARRVDGVVVPTRLLEEEFRQWSDHVVTFVNYPAPGFIDSRQKSWLPWVRRRNEVVHLGTLSMRRLKLLVGVASRFLRRRPDWSWAFLGMHPPMVEWFQANVPEDLRGRLRGLGKVSHEHVAAELCAARLGVNYHPLDNRQSEVAIPVKVFEYLACGLPVVSTRVPLMVELVGDCPAVALADENEDAYLEALDRLAQRPDLEALGGEARAFSDARFDCMAEGRRLAELYEAICR